MNRRGGGVGRGDGQPKGKLLLDCWLVGQNCLNAKKINLGRQA